jgi:hypothetical protein
LKAIRKGVSVVTIIPLSASNRSETILSDVNLEFSELMIINENLSYLRIPRSVPMKTCPSGLVQIAVTLLEGRMEFSEVYLTVFMFFFLIMINPFVVPIHHAVKLSDRAVINSSFARKDEGSGACCAIMIEGSSKKASRNALLVFTILI